MILMDDFPSPRRLTCGQCGTEFTCGSGGAKGGCWCADLPVKLPVEGPDCLCPTCLKAKIAAVSPPVVELSLPE